MLPVRVEQWYHACIVCSDLDRSVGFYRDVLGAELVTEIREDDLSGVGDFLALPGDGRCRWAFLGWAGGSTVLEVQEYRVPGRHIPRETRDVGVARIALRVPDADAARAAIVQAGIEVVGTIDAVFPERGGITRRGLSIRDPDGLLVELIEYSELNDPPRGGDDG